MAAAAKPAPPRSLPADELAKLVSDLTGADDLKALAAAKKLGDSGAPNAADPLTDVLAVGATPPLAAEAIAALRKLHDPRTVQILTLYSGNRNVPVRLAAVRALGEINDARVVGTLIERLGDGAPDVRAAAADALATRKEKRAADRLFKLVARGDMGAAGPLGTLISPDEIPRLAELSGRVEGNVLATAFGEFVKRPDVADRLRLDVVRTVARIPGAAATAALVEYLQSIPESDTRASKDETQKLLDARK